MNEIDLLKGLNEIDDMYIEQARTTKLKNRGKTIWVRWTSAAAVLFVVFAFLWPMWNGTPTVRADNLMDGISPKPVKTVQLDAGTGVVLDFSARLMQNANIAGENTLISPISALYALSMTANGAAGETLSEMESVLGMSVNGLNDWLYSYSRTINTEQLKLANSIWFADKDDFKVNQDFLQVNADYYNVDLFCTAFDDTTAGDINHWVHHKTKGMIPDVVNDVEDVLMYLINAVCFEAKWEEKYEKSDICPDIFTREDGTELSVDFLHSRETLFLQDNMAKGFIKNYEGGRYAFLALLPNEGISVEQYLAGLTGETVRNLLSGVTHTAVIVSMPKFETAYSADMTNALKQMGMIQAFDENSADFTGLGRYENQNIFISQVMQKTYICLDEKGTKAAATSVVIAAPTSAPIVDPVERIDLDRPYVYMLMDMETGIPLFVGTMMDPAKS